MNNPVMKETMFGKGGRPIPFDIPTSTSSVELFVDGKRVTMSTPLLIALRDGAMKAAVEVDQKTGRTGVPIEVRHIRD